MPRGYEARDRPVRDIIKTREPPTTMRRSSSVAKKGAGAGRDRGQHGTRARIRIRTRRAALHRHWALVLSSPISVSHERHAIVVRRPVPVVVQSAVARVSFSSTREEPLRRLTGSCVQSPTRWTGSPLRKEETHARVSQAARRKYWKLGTQAGTRNAGRRSQRRRGRNARRKEGAPAEMECAATKANEREDGGGGRNTEEGRSSQR